MGFREKSLFLTVERNVLFGNIMIAWKARIPKEYFDAEENFADLLEFRGVAPLKNLYSESSRVDLPQTFSLKRRA